MNLSITCAKEMKFCQALNDDPMVNALSSNMVIILHVPISLTWYHNILYRQPNKIMAYLTFHK